MKKTKRYQTNLISGIIVLVTLVLLVLLGIMLINHTKLETRFDAIVSMLERIDKAVANLDTEREILVCIAALYIAKCQLPIPLSFLCVISGMVFPIREALLINIAGIMFFFCVKYFEGMWIGGGWAGMILNIKQMRFIRDWIQFKGNGNPYVLPARLFSETLYLHQNRCGNQKPVFAAFYNYGYDFGRICGHHKPVL